MNSKSNFRLLVPTTLGILALCTSSFEAAAGDISARNREKVQEIMSRMTLDEKIGQMTQVDMNAVKDKSDISRYAFGSMLSGGDSDPADISPKGWLQSCRDFQEYALQSRLKIPLIYGIDAVHGHNNVDGAVVFPHNIGLGATRNASLVRKASEITAREVAGTGMHWAFAPCVAAAQNIHWGRTYESFSENPQLAGELGLAATLGLQKRLPGGLSILACPKHYAGDGGTRNGIDQGDTVVDEATLRRLHIDQYRPSIKAGAASIMVSYNSWNGQKLHGHRQLLTDVLKSELAFEGFLVSDWAAIDQLSSDYKVAIERSINAGVDMAMIPNGPGQKNSYVDFIRYVKQLVAENKISQERIDDAVRRILAVKVRMGVFENPFGSPKLLEEVGSAAHRKVARECVRASLVLFKNEGKALPLKGNLGRIAVVGRGADNLGMQCGGWTITWQGKTGDVTRGGTTILSGIRQLAPRGTEIAFSPDGSDLSGATTIIAVVGEEPYAEMKGDRTDLSLSVDDLALLEKCRATGARVVTVLLSGRPLVLGKALDYSDAFVAAWLPGTEGQGVADVLFGRSKPTGKLPRTWPRDNGQLALTSNEPGAENKALFPFGYGLTY
jgi:beta-glucosidase